jgi:hypothetical protein
VAPLDSARLHAANDNPDKTRQGRRCLPDRPFAAHNCMARWPIPDGRVRTVVPSSASRSRP